MRKILKSIEKLKTSYPGKTFVLAVSGGVDSMVLLDAAAKIKLNCIVVNFNHHKRKASLKESELVKKVALKHGYKVFLKDIKISANNNFQKNARECRIALLKEIAEENNTNIIVTAHHQNDLAETMLMNFSKQGLFNSLSGFNTAYSKDGFIYLKPFKGILKSELYQYAKKRNLEFSEDESNLKNIYTRNRFRNDILPMLTKENPKIAERLHILSNIFQSIDRKLSKTAADFIQNKEVFLNKKYSILPLHNRLYILAELFNSKKITFNLRKLTQIDTLILSSKPNLEIKLNDTWFFEKKYTEFTLTNRTKQSLLYKYNIDNFNFSSNPTQTRLTNCIIEYSTGALRPPFFVKTCTKGDRLSYSYGTKLVSKLFKDAKVPLNFRKHYPILTDSTGQIIYIPKLYKNDTLGVGEILQIEFIGELCEI